MDLTLEGKFSRKTSEIQFHDLTRIRETIKKYMDVYPIRQATININKECFSIMSFIIVDGKIIQTKNREYASTA